MICRCPRHANRDGWLTHTLSLAFVPELRCAAASAIRRRGSSPLHGAKKTRCGACGTMHRSFYDRAPRQLRNLPGRPIRICLDPEARRVYCPQSASVKRERFQFLVDNPFYTQRFAHYVGRRCRSATIKDIAEELRLHWDAVKELDKQYMRAQLGVECRHAVEADQMQPRSGYQRRLMPRNMPQSPQGVPTCGCLLPSAHLLAAYAVRTGAGQLPASQESRVADAVVGPLVQALRGCVNLPLPRRVAQLRFGS